MHDGPLLDLRSDTVTQPDPGMRQAMAAAQVGDDVYGEDPSVSSLQERVAQMLGKEAGLFVPSGTQSNLIAMLSHCGRGDEVITGRPYHVCHYEAGGASVLGSIVIYPLDVTADGALDPSQIAEAVKPEDTHHAVSRLLSLENTHNGMTISLERCHAMADAGRERGLVVHLDGARLANAAVRLGVQLDQACAYADTVSLCLSKGLGTPAGSVLVGPKDFIEAAKRWRKMLGGGMRQAGVLAAAGHYALDHWLPKLAEDHQRTAHIVASVPDTDHLMVLRDRTDTNMFFLTLPKGGHASLAEHLLQQGVKIGGEAAVQRMVVHHDIDDKGAARIIQALNSWNGAK